MVYIGNARAENPNMEWWGNQAIRHRKPLPSLGCGRERKVCSCGTTEVSATRWKFVSWRASLVGDAVTMGDPILGERENELGFSLPPTFQCSTRASHCPNSSPGSLGKVAQRAEPTWDSQQSWGRVKDNMQENNPAPTGHSWPPPVQTSRKCLIRPSSEQGSRVHGFSKRNAFHLGRDARNIRFQALMFYKCAKQMKICYCRQCSNIRGTCLHNGGK